MANNDRRLVSYTLGRTQSEKLFPPPGTESESVTYHTQRHRTLPPGEVARLPVGHGLLLRGTHWGLLRLTPWSLTEPWATVAIEPPVLGPAEPQRRAQG